LPPEDEWFETKALILFYRSGEYKTAQAYEPGAEVFLHPTRTELHPSGRQYIKGSLNRQGIQPYSGIFFIFHIHLHHTLNEDWKMSTI
jgi:hypothetical protein